MKSLLGRRRVGRHDYFALATELTESEDLRFEVPLINSNTQLHKLLTTCPKTPHREIRFAVIQNVDTENRLLLLLEKQL